MDRQGRAADDSRNKPYNYPGGIEVTRLRPEHAGIYPRLRQADRDEMEACSPMNPMLQLGYSIALSSPGYAILKDGQVEVVFGATGSANGAGVPWLLATPEVERHPITFLRASRGFIDEMKERYNRLENWVHVQNKLSMRWLRWAGFEFDKPDSSRPDFIRFFWEGK